MHHEHSSISLTLFPSLPLSLFRHGNGQVFSCKGILLAVQYFRKRGHTKITVFVPQWRKESSKPDSPIIDQEVLLQLEREGLINFTPSRRIGAKKIVCYDDRFIVRLAAETGGVIVSNDNFRDLLDEDPLWRETIEKRLLMFTFAEDLFMVPTDPLGKYGPHLDSFLRFEGGKMPSKDLAGDRPVPQDRQPCPYAERCTFGPKCRFYHPEREQRMREREAERSAKSISPPSSSGLRGRDAGEVAISPVDAELSARVKQLSLHHSPQKMAARGLPHTGLTKASSSNSIGDNVMGRQYPAVPSAHSMDSLHSLPVHERKSPPHPITFPIATNHWYQGHGGREDVLLSPTRRSASSDRLEGVGHSYYPPHMTDPSHLPYYTNSHLPYPHPHTHPHNQHFVPPAPLPRPDLLHTGSTHPCSLSSTSVAYSHHGHHPVDSSLLGLAQYQQPEVAPLAHHCPFPGRPHSARLPRTDRDPSLPHLSDRYQSYPTLDSQSVVARVAHTHNGTMVNQAR